MFHDRTASVNWKSLIGKPVSPLQDIASAVETTASFGSLRFDWLLWTRSWNLCTRVFRKTLQVLTQTRREEGSQNLLLKHIAIRFSELMSCASLSASKYAAACISTWVYPLNHAHMHRLPCTCIVTCKHVQCTPDSKPGSKIASMQNGSVLNQWLSKRIDYYRNSEWRSSFP